MDGLFAVGDRKRVREIGSFVDVEPINSDGYTLLEAKSMLFLSQIFHLLLPKNSPQPVRVKKTIGGNYSVAYEKIPHDPLHDKVNRHRLNTYEFWKENRGIAVSVKDPQFLKIRAEIKEMYSKLSAFTDDPKYQELMTQIQKYGFGDLYELNPVNVIKDERNSEYVFIDLEPAIRRYRKRGTIGTLGIPTVVTELRISLEEVRKAIDEKLTGEPHKMAMQYLRRLMELLPKKYEKAFKNQHESRVIVQRFGL